MDDPANQIEAIFTRALAHTESAERTAYLNEACGSDAGLRARVEALLRANENAGSFMASPNRTEASDAFIGETLDAAPSFDPAAFRRASAPRPEDSLAEKAGSVIGHYKLLQKIGEGGFGAVWMADQEKPVRRRVALKIIKAGMDTKQVITRFEQERQALAMMDHPNIAKVLDAGATQTGRPYFVMELVRGLKITDYCDQQGLSTEERIKLFITVCHAVQHAHQKGIIHRDLKPSNILVTINDGEAVPKVIDFGVAKATQGRLTDGTLFTQFEQMIGTPLYMSPEQAEITSLDVDTRSDIYALGVLLYELLTGRTPIDTATMARAGMDEVRRLIREVDPPRPSARLKTLEGNELTTAAKRRHTEPAKLPNALRGDIDWIVMKCLEKDRKRRYDTANGLAMDLQRHLSNDVVVARPPTTAYLLSKLIRRNKVACVAGAAIAASLLIGIAASVWQAVRATVAERRVSAALNELRASAPAFAEQARGLAARERFDEAIEKLDYAIKLRPDTAEYLVAKADLLQCQLKLADAATVYRQALRIKPGTARAEASAKLCDELLAAPLSDHAKLTRESLAKLHLAMQKQQRPAAELMPVARLLGEEKKLLLDYWLARFKDLPLSAEKPLKDRLTVREDGRLALDLSDTKVIDLSPLVGAPLAVLNLSGTRERSDLADLSLLRGLNLLELNISATSVADLSPLREMHTLEKLEMSGSKVTNLSELSALRLKSINFLACDISDLSPLRKMPLEEIHLRGTRVADLSPLIGMPIKTIDLSMAPVLDFSPLAQLPLEKCYLQHNRITDLSVLRGKPLKELVLWGCADAHNYGVLSEIKTLELLLLPSEYRTLPEEDYAAIGKLRELPKLRQLGSDIMNQMGYAATGSKDIFWKDWDREQAFVPALRKSGIAFSLQKLPTGSYHLFIQNQPLRDLSILRGAPISELTLYNCPFADLTPIHDLKLEKFSLHSDFVADLSPLGGMPLKYIYLAGPKIIDLSPLKDLPLKELYLHACGNLTDVAAVAELPSLENVTVPVTAASIEALRKLPRLQRLAFARTGTGMPDATAAEFWQEWTRLSWMRALKGAGIKYVATRVVEKTPQAASPKATSKVKKKSTKKPVRSPTMMWTVTIQSKDFHDCSIFKGADNIGELNLNGTAVDDLQPLREMALTKLSLDETRVNDLGPLQDMPLEELSLLKTKVTDLSALRGMPLKRIELGNTAVTDLEPLRDMALEVLRLYNTSVSDLGPLRGMPLKELHVSGTKVKDLSVLRGMPLTYLRFHNCGELTDLSPIANCRELQSLTLPPNAQDYEFLRALPKLERLSYKEDSKRGYRPTETAAEFWKDYDGSGWLRSLTAAGITHSAKKEADGWAVTVSSKDFSDCSMFKGTPISRLTLDKTSVVDLEPLRGLQLKQLSLRETKVVDLGPLKGIPLEYLALTRTKVADLSALRGMPLKKLYLGDTGVRDLEPLRGMPLTNLTLYKTQVTDLSVLAGMPLQELSLFGLKVNELSPLAQAPELTQLTLPSNAKNIEFLRSFAKLQHLSFTAESKTGYMPNKTAEAFWKEYDGQSVLRKLRDSGVEIKGSKQLSDGTWDLILDHSTIRDLAVLRGFPIGALSLNTTAVSDLTPLRDLPIKNLNLSNCEVTDLSPLKGVPLASLILRGTGVTDLSALRGMPLTSLYMAHCRDLCDLSPLKDCKELTEITLPENAKDFEFLRTSPKLERISFAEAAKAGLRPGISPDQSAAEFWKEYDANAWLRKLRGSGVAIKATKQLADGTWDLDLSEAKLADLTLLKDSPISSLTLNKTAVADLTPLKGMALRTLKLDGTAVIDLGPLKGMPLKELSITGTKVADISTLQGMPIKKLSLGNTEITDLGPVLGMPLKQLRIYNNQVADLSPLKGMELELLNMAGTKVSDLSALRGMPLTSLRLHSCKDLTDISPLTQARELKDLTLPPQAKDFEFLRTLPKLDHLSFTETTRGFRQPDKTAEEFWKEYDSKVR